MRNPVIDQLRKQRRNSDLSQLAITISCGMSQGQLSAYENERNSPTLKMLCKWAEALDCELVVQPKAKP